MSAAMNEPADLHEAVNPLTACLGASPPAFKAEIATGSQGAAQADSQKATA